MTGDQVLAVRAALFRPSPEALRRDLPEIGEGLLAQFLELHSRPTPDGAERLAANLKGAARLALEHQLLLAAAEET